MTDKHRKQSHDDSLKKPKKNPEDVSHAHSEKKQAKRYVLTVLRDGEYEPLSPTEMELFEQQHPELARYWLEQCALDSLQAPRFPESVPIYESWDKAAKRLLSTLKKSPNARLFQDPIDVK
jgi:hypothetical protein